MKAAAEAQRAAIRLDPNDAFAYFNLGQILHQRGCPAEAILWLQRAILLRPKDPALHQYLGIVLHASGERNAARSEWETVLELDARGAIAADARKALSLYFGIAD